MTQNFYSVFDLVDQIFNQYDASEYVASNIDFDIIKSEDNYQIDLYLPGFDKSNVKIDFIDEHLSISGERKEEPLNYSTKNGFFGKFEKKWKLSNKFNADSIDATFNNGILTIKIPFNKVNIKPIEIK